MSNSKEEGNTTTNTNDGGIDDLLNFGPSSADQSQDQTYTTNIAPQTDLLS